MPHLQESHQLVQQTSKRLATDVLAPAAKRLDKGQAYSGAVLEMLAELGLFGIALPSEFGGDGLDLLSRTLALEQLSAGCATTGALLTVHYLYCGCIARHGSDSQKREHLEPFTRGRIGAYALTEPHCGSDAAALKTSARLEGDSWVLNGTKAWVTNGLIASAAIVFAVVAGRPRSISAFIVPLPTHGITFGAEEQLLGLRGLASGAMYLDDCRIPRANLLGDIGEGLQIALSALSESRVSMGAQALGIANAALTLAKDYALERRAFGQALAELQSIQFKLAEMVMRIEAARLMVYEASQQLDARALPHPKWAAMAKVLASETATFVAHQTIQIMGASGLSRDNPAERYYRDARVTEIYAGTSEILRLVIARDLLGTAAAPPSFAEHLPELGLEAPPAVADFTMARMGRES